MLSTFAIVAICLTAPVNGEVVREYSPVGQYGGHWGIDFAAPLGSTVSSPVSGSVTFAGSVAGMKSITIEPVPGYKVSVSYLTDVDAHVGSFVRRGDVIGHSGAPHGAPGAHLSVRLDGRYVDPADLLGCGETDITRALRLLPPPSPYPRRRAHRNTRRHLRPDPQRASSSGKGGVGAVAARPRLDHARWGAMAEV